MRVVGNVLLRVWGAGRTFMTENVPCGVLLHLRGNDFLSRPAAVRSQPTVHAHCIVVDATEGLC